MLTTFKKDWYATRRPLGPRATQYSSLALLQNTQFWSGIQDSRNNNVWLCSEYKREYCKLMLVKNALSHCNLHELRNQRSKSCIHFANKLLESPNVSPLATTLSWRDWEKQNSQCKSCLNFHTTVPYTWLSFGMRRHLEFQLCPGHFAPLYLPHVY